MKLSQKITIENSMYFLQTIMSIHKMTFYSKLHTYFSSTNTKQTESKIIAYVSKLEKVKPATIHRIAKHVLRHYKQLRMKSSREVTRTWRKYRSTRDSHV